MRIIFFGSAHFALPSLKGLVDSGQEICCIVTQPDRKKGRGMSFAKTAIKEFAEERGIGLYQPEKINTPESAEFLKKFKPDLFVVIAYGQILSRQLLEIPAIMPLNAHGSLLPLYRGAAPINWAIINGETQTGITIIKMTEKMDAGPMIAIKSEKIKPEDDFISLENRLSLLAAPLLTQTLKAIAAHDYRSTPQDEKKATFAPKLKKENGLIDWDKRAEEVYNLIRGLSGWPGAFTYYDGKMLKILKAGLSRSQSLQIAKSPGEIIAVSKEGIVVATKEGELIIKGLQIEGKREMTAVEFTAGHKIAAGDVLSAKK
jgi:methionyl-tRNA formyltransferase